MCMYVLCILSCFWKQQITTKGHVFNCVTKLYPFNVQVRIWKWRNMWRYRCFMKDHKANNFTRYNEYRSLTPRLLLPIYFDIRKPQAVSMWFTYSRDVSRDQSTRDFRRMLIFWSGSLYSRFSPRPYELRYCIYLSNVCETRSFSALLSGSKEAEVEGDDGGLWWDIRGGGRGRRGRGQGRGGAAAQIRSGPGGSARIRARHCVRLPAALDLFISRLLISTDHTKAIRNSVLI